MINQTIRRFVSFSSITSTNIISRRRYNHNNNLICRSLSSASFNTSLINVDVKDNGVCVVTLNRPKARNALSTELATQMCGVFQDITDATIKPTDLASVRCVILTGAGSSFCAGADLKERQGMTDEQWSDQHKVFQKAGLLFQNLPMPTIVAANGHAFGGGFEFVCLADWAVASKDALFRFPEVRLGIFPGLGGTQTLPRLIGLPNARRMLLTGCPITAEEGYRYGLFTMVEETGEKCLEKAIEDGNMICENGPQGVRRAKRSIWEGYQKSDFKEAWDFSLELYGECFRSDERIEGIKAYGEKRAPKFD